MASLKLFICVSILVACLNYVQALTKEEVTAWSDRIMPHITECSKEFGLAEEALKEAKQNGDIDSIDSCFFACVFKKRGLMNDGKFDTAKALEKAKEILKTDEDIKIAAEAIDDCASVNSEDGNECARAKSLVKCLSKHKSKFNLV